VVEQWAVVKLADIAEIQTGSTPSKKNLEFYGGEYPLFKPGDLGSIYPVNKTEDYLTESGRDVARQIPENSTYVTCIGATIGKTGFVDVPATCNQQINTLSPLTGVEPKLLFYWMISPQMNRQVVLGSSSTTMPIINKSRFSNLDSVLPPLAEQKVIAEKLDKLLAKVDSIKARLDAVPDTLKRFRQSVLAAAVSGKLTEEWRKSSTANAEEDFKALLIQEKEYLDRKKKDDETKIIKEKQKFRKEVTNGDVNDIPSGWIIKPFFELCLLNRGFDLPTAKRKAGDYPILSAGGEIGSHNEFKVNGPCITVGRSGSVGQVFYTTLNAWPLNTALYAKSYGFSDPKFIFYKLKSMDLTQYASSTAVPTLNRNEFTHEAVAIPPSSEQTEIVRRVEKLFAYADKVEAEVNAAQERVNKLTQSILAKAFRGELTAKWREQNPELISGENSAEALLASIQKERKAEREKLKSKNKTRTRKAKP